MPIVYMVTNKITGDRYIGHTAQRFSARRGNQAYKARHKIRSDPFHDAIGQYGMENFLYEVIDELDDWFEVLEREKFLIRTCKPEYNSRMNGASPGRRKVPKLRIRPDRSSLPGEEWRPIEGYEGRYEVSSLGRARSLDFTTPTSNGRQRINVGRILKLSKNGDQYLWFVPGKGNPSIAIHVAIANAFLGPKPDGTHVLHKDDDKSNCQLSNLYYGTLKQNSMDRSRNGNGGPIIHHVLLIDEVRDIKQRLLNGEAIRSIARHYNVNPRSIKLIRDRRSYAYVAP